MGVMVCLCLSRIKEDHVIQHGLVVDGASLSLALREHEKLFMDVCKNCSAVLCCRMAPLQKAKVSYLTPSRVCVCVFRFQVRGRTHTYTLYCPTLPCCFHALVLKAPVCLAGGETVEDFP